MHIKRFEEYVSQKILDRGFYYYEQDLVTELEQIEQGVFQAVVWGSTTYDVYVKINQESIVEHSCSCPYDWGDICKHEVAVFYYLRDSEIYLEQSNTQDQVSSILEKLSESDLRQILKKYLRENPSIRQNFLQNFQKEI